MAGVVVRGNFRLFVCGSSSSGKTHFVTDLLLSEDAIVPKPVDVLLVYTYNQPAYKRLHDHFGRHLFEYKEFLPELLDEKYLQQFERPILLIDDALSHLKDEKTYKQLEKLLVAASSHLNISCILTYQVLFPHRFKSLSDQANYFALFNVPDYGSLHSWASRKFGRDAAKSVAEIYKVVTANAFGYLFVSLHPTERAVRFRTNVLGENEPRHCQRVFYINLPTDTTYTIKVEE